MTTILVVYETGGTTCHDTFNFVDEQAGDFSITWAPGACVTVRMREGYDGNGKRVRYKQYGNVYSATVFEEE